MLRLLCLAVAFLTIIGIARADSSCVIASDLTSGEIVLQEGEICDERIGPASTFKFVLAVIGYDAGILVDAETPAWPYKDSYGAVRAADKTTVTPRTWMRDSVLWYSRELVAALGAERFAGYIRRFGYGNANVSGDPGADNGLTHSWLNTSLLVSPLEQMTFVRRVVLGDLPVSANALRRAAAITPAFEADDGWLLRGKTGTGYIREVDGRLGKRQYGWFIGWATRDGRTLVFAALHKNDEPGGSALGPKTRDALVARWADLVDAAEQ